MNIPTLLNVSTDWTPIFYLRIPTNKKKINVFHGIEKEREKMLLFQKKKKPFERKLKLIKRNNKIAIGMKYKFNSKSNKSIFAMYLSLHHSSNSTESSSGDGFKFFKADTDGRTIVGNHGMIYFF